MLYVNKQLMRDTSSKHAKKENIPIKCLSLNVNVDVHVYVFNCSHKSRYPRGFASLYNYTPQIGTHSFMVSHPKGDSTFPFLHINVIVFDMEVMFSIALVCLFDCLPVCNINQQVINSL